MDNIHRKTLLIIAATLPSIGALLYFVVLAATPFAQPVYSVTKILMLVFLGVAVGRRVVARPSLHLSWSTILLGLGHGLVLVTLLIAAFLLVQPMLIEATPGIAQKITDFPVLVQYYLPAAVLFSLFHSLFEELYWRGLVGSLLSTVTKPSVALLLGSLAFTAHHVIVLSQFFPPLLTVIGSAGVCAAGASWVWLYRKSGSLVAPWISHIAADLAIFALGYLIITRGVALG